MDLSDIFSDAIHYPINNYKNWLYICVVFFISDIVTAIATIYDSSAVVVIPLLICFILSLLITGITIHVMRSTIEGSPDIPMIDFVDDIVSGIESIILFIVYAIIPIVITIVCIDYLNIGKQISEIISYIDFSAVQATGVLDINQLISIIPQDLVTGFITNVIILLLIINCITIIIGYDNSYGIL